MLTEEFLAYGVPVAAHWFADRQTDPLLLRFGPNYQKEFFLPKIVKGECYFVIGLSEPNSGSDLASVSTRAEKVEGSWIVNGAKTWSSNVHDAHYMVTLVRTARVLTAAEAKEKGLVTFVVSDEELESFTQSYAEKLAAGPIETIKIIKRVVYQSQTMSLRSSLDYISSKMGLVTEFPAYEEGVKAIIEKRKVVFK